MKKRYGFFTVDSKNGCRYHGSIYCDRIEEELAPSAERTVFYIHGISEMTLWHSSGLIVKEITSDSQSILDVVRSLQEMSNESNVLATF